jgi:predicted PurR-regulated permease PerM
VISDVLNLYNQLIVWLMRPHIIPNLPVDFTQLANRLIEFRSTFLSSLTDQALQLIGSTSLGALWVLFTLVAVYYFLAEWPRLRGSFIASFPEAYQPELTELYRRLRRVWMNYLRGQLLLMLIVGVVFTLAWTIIGIRGALVLGVIAGFLTLIPDVGPLIAVLLAAGVTLLEGSSWIHLPNPAIVAIILAVYVFLVAIKNIWIRPLIMGRSVNMNQALVLISIILATFLWGILGALLIVPVLASAGVVLRFLQHKLLGQPPFPEGSPGVENDPDLPIMEPVVPASGRRVRKI